MKTWTWQKWVGKLIPFILGVGGEVFAFIELGQPQWWILGTAALIGVGQWLVGTFPAKE